MTQDQALAYGWKKAELISIIFGEIVALAVGKHPLSKDMMTTEKYLSDLWHTGQTIAQALDRWNESEPLTIYYAPVQYGDHCTTQLQSTPENAISVQTWDHAGLGLSVIYKLTIYKKGVKDFHMFTRRITKPTAEAKWLPYCLDEVTESHIADEHKKAHLLEAFA